VVPPASRPISRVGRYSGTPLRAALLSATGLSPSSGPRSRGLRLAPPHASVGPTTPPPQGGRFGLGPVRSPLLRASRLISLPPGTEMFQFPGFASRRSVMTGFTARRVSPFGHLGITACVPLPRAYRSLPRPSSPPCAQASPTCLQSLDYVTPLIGDAPAHRILSVRADLVLHSLLAACSARRLSPTATHARGGSIPYDLLNPSLFKQRPAAGKRPR
jgi:hypothetical protein